MVLLADFGTEFGSLWTGLAGVVQSWFFWIGLACVLIWYVPQAAALVRRKTDTDLPGRDCATKRMELIAARRAELATYEKENADMVKILTGGPA